MSRTRASSRAGSTKSSSAKGRVPRIRDDDYDRMEGRRLVIRQLQVSTIIDTIIHGGRSILSV